MNEYSPAERVIITSVINAYSIIGIGKVGFYKKNI